MISFHTVSKLPVCRHSKLEGMCKVRGIPSDETVHLVLKAVQLVILLSRDSQAAFWGLPPLQTWLGSTSALYVARHSLSRIPG